MDGALSADLIWFLIALVGAGLFAGFLGGLFGIGGGIVVVPALYTLFTALGVPEQVVIKTAVGTSLATIIVTSLRSLSAHHKKGAVEVSILKNWGPWIAGGAIAGAIMTRFIDANLLTLLFAVGALLIGLQKLTSLRSVEKAESTAKQSSIPLSTGAVLGSATGVLSAIMGVGGGILGVLILTHFGRSMHKAVATAAGFGVAIAIPGTIGMMIAGWGIEGLPSWSVGFVNLPAFLVVAAMTFISAPFGARAAHRLKGRTLTLVFALYLLLTAGLLIRDSLGTLI